MIDSGEAPRHGTAMAGGECAVAERWPAGPAPVEARALTDRPRGHDADFRDVLAARAGDAGAFEGLVRRHEKALARQMWRFSRDVRVRNELVQDAFVEAYLSLKSYRPGTPFLHWLRRIATRIGYRHWQTLERQKRHVTIEDGAAALPSSGGAGEAASPAQKAAELLARQIGRAHV